MKTLVRLILLATALFIHDFFHWWDFDETAILNLRSTEEDDEYVDSNRIDINSRLWLATQAGSLQYTTISSSRCRCSLASATVLKCNDPGMWAALKPHSCMAMTNLKSSPRSSLAFNSSRLIVLISGSM